MSAGSGVKKSEFRGGSSNVSRVHQVQHRRLPATLAGNGRRGAVTRWQGCGLPVRPKRTTGGHRVKRSCFSFGKRAPSGNEGISHAAKPRDDLARCKATHSRQIKPAGRKRAFGAFGRKVRLRLLALHQRKKSVHSCFPILSFVAITARVARFGGQFENTEHAAHIRITFGCSDITRWLYVLCWSFSNRAAMWLLAHRFGCRAVAPLTDLFSASAQESRTGCDYYPSSYFPKNLSTFFSLM